ncbi:hypothetical protein [Burkholderia cenocepacia]|jgi:hypothetical protein|uniref:hypothetical protein n=1 Tax=Burkholderia cenocepacia TaxID=95486 RepID=UPI001639982A|nr:hypothetical protein [Burkholderia cenocepacia]
MALSVLLQLDVLASFIGEVRRRELRAEILLATKRGINAALELGKASGEWAVVPRTG